MILESKWVNGSMAIDLHTCFDSRIIRNHWEMSEILSKDCFDCISLISQPFWEISWLVSVDLIPTDPRITKSVYVPISVRVQIHTVIQPSTLYAPMHPISTSMTSTSTLLCIWSLSDASYPHLTSAIQLSDSLFEKSQSRNFATSQHLARTSHHLRTSFVLIHSHLQMFPSSSGTSDIVTISWVWPLGSVQRYFQLYSIWSLFPLIHRI
jgi:hypothetical protein